MASSKLGIGLLHAFPMQDGRYCLYQRAGSMFVVGEPMPAVHPVPSQKETIFVLVRNGDVIAVCEEADYNTWKDKKSAGDTTRQPLQGVPAVIHPEPLPDSQVQALVFLTLTPAESNVAAHEILWHVGYTGPVEVIDD